MRNGIVITEATIIALIGLIASFYAGAVVEVKTDGKVTKSINYDVNRTSTCRCDECSEIKLEDE